MLPSDLETQIEDHNTLDRPPEPRHGSTDYLVEARNIGVRRGNRWLVRYVNISVKRGDIVFLVGANGSGKSTCAKVLLGLMEPDEGSLKRSRTVRMGYVPQRLTISPVLPLSLRRMMRLTGSFTALEIDSALAAVGLDRLGDPQVTTLSGGELQRLLLAQALIHRPNLLILDEPEQGVDIVGTDVLHKLIDDIRADLGCGVLIISHDLERSMEAGDDFIVLVPHEHDEPQASTNGPNAASGSGRRRSRDLNIVG